MNDWLDYTVEHEFSTGRTATLRKRLPTLHLIEQGVLTEEVAPLLEKVAKGQLGSWAEATRVMRVICEGVFVNPRIADVPAPTETEGGVVAIPFEALADEEVVETFELVAEALAASQRFRDQRSGAGGGGDGEGVGDDPVEAGGSASGERGSARARRPARAAAAGQAGGAKARRPARAGGPGGGGGGA